MAAESENISSVKMELGSNGAADEIDDSSKNTGAEKDTNDQLASRRAQVRAERGVWRNSVEGKSSLLSNAWNELYNLLGEYKAELFRHDDLALKYDSISDVEHLRSELLEKDTVISEKEHENDQLRDQMEQLQREYEQLQMDLSVKDGLLKKYQEDLLQKEASLLTSTTKNTRLENKLRMLENAADGSPPRKMMRTHLTGRLTPAGAVRAMASSGRLAAGKLPGRLTSTPLSRRKAAQPQQAAPAQGPTTSKDPVVCIEVEDESELQQVSNAAETADEQVYMGVWSGGDELTQAQSDTDSLQTSDTGQYHSQEDINQGMMVQDESTTSDQDTSSWPMIDMGSVDDMTPQPNQSPSNKDNQCPICFRILRDKYKVERHVKVVHLKIKNFVCDLCPKAFGARDELKLHMVTKHNTFMQ